jgi:hypothetical protein
MLRAGLLLFSSGRVRCSTAAAPATFNGGTPITSGGLLSLTASAPTIYAQGVGYIAATGSLAADIGGAVASFAQGLPFTSAGRIACDQVGAISTYVAGIPRTATGAIATAAPE